MEDGEELTSSGPQTLLDNGPEFGESVAKRFCESNNKRYSTEEKRFVVQEADSNHSTVGKRFVEPGQVLTYPHSMPASPTMFDTRYALVIQTMKGPLHYIFTC